ncbi:uncharacterized protein HMPREF1541_08421 [Cyphellophora europaea CBS 101466]|uniref:EthD domain-containing protein n=1 Tax=Cyphellophora europaea (strain CBS 101466) TaxID=1220924 RepID=W2RMA7_CYPE1|nr:uncharacterized protein HMPREF1541_08421 [Cyphellophora europaea CBS 101466]ETN37430.1 hypothetical protein HMPREF1541_08421 [Cyphellophora europaea CBS 101466]
MAATPSKPITTVVSYPSKDPKTGAPLTFNMEYYLSKHMPLIDKVWGKHNMLRWHIHQFPSPDPVTGEAPPYGVQTTIYWETVEDFKAAMADAGSAVTGKDVERFSNVWPVIWTGEVAGSEERGGVEENMKSFVYGEGGL